MTNGIVSVRKDLAMLYKIVVGHDGSKAGSVARQIQYNYQMTGKIPTIEELFGVCDDNGFGCKDCLIILEADPDHYSHPKAHCGPEIDGDLDERYFDTFHVAQFNPRWKYGTAPHVEIVDL